MHKKRNKGLRFKGDILSFDFHLAFVNEDNKHLKKNAFRSDRRSASARADIWVDRQSNLER